MKRKAAALLLCAAFALSAGACAESGGADGTQATESTAEAETYNGKSSAAFTLDYKELVPTLADYQKIQATITGDYEVTDEDVESNILALLPYYGVTGVEVTDHDVVQADDYVLIDYTGYANGEAFDGGSSTDIMFDVANNYDVTNQSSYIDGFADGLVGARVGGTASSDVTFPDDYQSETLAGQDATFEFTVKGIYTAVTMDNLTDEMVEEAFGSMGMTTKENLTDYVRGVLESQASTKKTQASISAVEDYLLENSVVEIPDDYMDARMAEYQYSYENEYCGTQTLEEYAKSNSTTAEELKENWKEQLTEQIKIEFIFGRIAEEEGITVDDDSFETFVEYLVSESSSELSDTEALYEYYGAGSVSDGEATLRRMYLVNNAITAVVEDADITVEEESTEE